MLNTTKQVLNTAWEAYYESLMPSILCPFLMLPQVKPTATGATHHGVPAESGLVGERAAAEATHVGLLSRVDALVPLEGIELRELLLAVLTAVRTLA